MDWKQTTLVLAILAAVVVSAQKAEETDICKKCKCDATTKTVDCSNKSLTSIFSDDQWKALNSTDFVIERLDLSHNSIANVTQFPELLSVKYLNLHDNLIATLAFRVFHNLPQLEELNLSRCGLSRGVLDPHVFAGNYDPTWYEPLKKLRKLDLSQNVIHALNSDIFEHMSAIEVVDLHENPFKVIDSQTEIAISNLPDTLRVLDMSALQVFELPKNIFHSIRSLEVLNISDNAFHRVPEALAYAINLKELVFDENPVSVLDSFTGFPKLEKLEKLSMSYISNLEVIEAGALSNLTNLKWLEIVQNNHLREIHADAFSRPGAENQSHREWPPVETLYLHHNVLKYLDENMLAGWESMKLIDIRGNSWSCDCNNQWLTGTLIPIIKKHDSTVIDDLECAAPEPMAGRKLKELADKGYKMRCLDSMGNHPERDGQILIGLLLGICIGVPFTMLFLIFYKRGCFGLMRPRGPADFSRAYYKRAGVYEDSLNQI